MDYLWAVSGRHDQHEHWWMDHRAGVGCVLSQDLCWTCQGGWVDLDGWADLLPGRRPFSGSTSAPAISRFVATPPLTLHSRSPWLAACWYQHARVALWQWY